MPQGSPLPFVPDRQPQNLRVWRRWAGVLPRLAAGYLLPAAGAGQRVVLHIGPHKTATTTLQATLRGNADLLAPFWRVIMRDDPVANRLCLATRAAARPDQMAAAAPVIAGRARTLARSCRHLPRVLISHEDLLGARPTRRGELGFYPTGATKLALIVAAFEELGARVEVIFTERPLPDWTASLQRDLVPDPAERIDPADFAVTHGFADDWQGCIADLSAAIGPGRLTVLPFEADLSNGQIGRAMLTHIGVPDDLLDQISWSPARRQSR